MPGICGFLAARDSAGEDLSAMLEALSGYGDASAVWARDGAGLGLRSASNPKRGRAIALHEDAQSGLVVAADVRLDNRRDLSDALGVSPSQREALDDAALVLRAFQRWGDACPDRLFGDFAFAIFDPGERKLFCARDALGARPFYYARLGGRFVFGTSLEAVLAAPSVPRVVDDAQIATALTVPHFEPRRTETLFKGVSKLEPGHSLTFADGVFRTQRHWRPERIREVRPVSDAAAVDELLDLLGQVVRDRLIGDPVGVEVSGGLDSTLLVALTARELERQQRPPALGFSMLPAPDETALREYKNEYEATILVAEHFAMPLHYEPFTVEHRVEELRGRFLFPGGGYPRVVPLAAELGVDVLLNGQGGDQGSISHNGFGYFHQLLARGQLPRFWALARSRGRPPLKQAARVVLDLAHPSTRMMLHRLRHRASRKVVPPPLNPDFARTARSARRVPRRRARRVFSVRGAQLLSLLSPLASLSMEALAAHEATFGVRRFAPLLDRRVVEFALGLPAEYYLRGSGERWLMRRVVERLMPAYATLDAGKEDRARSDASFAQLSMAVSKVRQLLEERDTPPAGAEHVDMPRLLEMLNTQWLQENRHKRHLLTAVLALLEF